MDPVALDVIMPFLALMGIGTMVLIGLKLRYNHKARLADKEGRSEDVERLTAAVGDLMDEVHALREGMTDLNERIEFTERMLTRGSAQGPGPTDRAN